ncbi:Flp pilus assembly complex ATPase component TadA (plasmid) [Citricoccus nitrophenolicus]
MTAQPISPSQYAPAPGAPAQAMPPMSPQTIQLMVQQMVGQMLAQQAHLNHTEQPSVKVMDPNDPYPNIMRHTPDVHSDAIQKLMDLVEHMAVNGISDCQLHPDKKTRWLRNGKYEVLPNRHPLDSFTQKEILLWLSFATVNDPDPLGKYGHASVSVEADIARLRGTFRRSLQGYTATFRLIPGTVPNADAVGVPKVIQNLTTKKSGLVLVEGSTGSGKTTMIASLLSKVNHESDQHIYTIEHPIEFVHQEVGNSSIVQREIGDHAESYPLAIEDALRSKPNVILVGELLNPATAKAALHAATTGHLVFTTAHAGSVVEALDSFVGQFTADEQPQIRQRLASSLLAVVVQRLIPTIPDEKGETKLAAGREILMNNPSFAEIIRGGKTEMIGAQMESQPQSNTMEESVARLVVDGSISEEEAYANVRLPDQLTKALEKFKAAKADQLAQQQASESGRARRRV